MIIIISIMSILALSTLLMASVVSEQTNQLND